MQIYCFRTDYVYEKREPPVPYNQYRAPRPQQLSEQKFLFNFRLEWCCTIKTRLYTNRYKRNPDMSLSYYIMAMWVLYVPVIKSVELRVSFEIRDSNYATWLQRCFYIVLRQYNIYYWTQLIFVMATVFCLIFWNR